MLRRVVTTVTRSRPAVALRPSSSHFCLPIRTLTTTSPDQIMTSKPLASDSFQLLAESEKAGAAEDSLYEQQLKDVEAWWASPRYDGIKRPYSPADVVSKRGSQMQTYPSSVMARKLFNLIKKREAAGEPIHTSMLESRDTLPPL